MLGVVLSGVVSLGVLASVVAGAIYVLFLAIRWHSCLRASLSGRPPAAASASATRSSSCARCGRRLHSVQPPRRLRCAHCRLPVCRQCCTRASNTRWLCVSCRKLRDVRLQSGEWFHQQLKQRFRSTVAALPGPDQTDEEVQEFLERLVESVIGEGLDDASLCPISHAPDYINFYVLYKEPLVHVLQRLYANLKMALLDTVPKDGDTASDLHTELKDLLKQIAQEASTMPKLRGEHHRSRMSPPTEDTPDSLEHKSYEDILATAILNKVFAKYQQDRRRRKRRHVEKNIDRNSNLVSEKIPMQMQGRSDSEGTEDSLDNSMDSWSETSSHEPLSVTIEECIEEVTTRYSSDDEDAPVTDIDRFLSSLKYVKRQRAPFPEFGKDVIDGGISSVESGEEGDRHREAAATGGEAASESNRSLGTELVSPVDSWEENWLFQRRRLKTDIGTCQPVPVPMLVPLPAQDFRAMIGGVDADEMSDLSDCSDSILEDLLDGPDDKKYFESQHEGDSDEDVVNKQRAVFLKYISEDLGQLLDPEGGPRGASPDTGQTTPYSTCALAQPAQVESVQELTAAEGPAKAQEASERQSPIEERLPKFQLSLDEGEKTDGVPEEGSGESVEGTNSSSSYSVLEARNLLRVPTDSGDGSLDMQQDSEYTVAYATLAQVRPSHTPTPIASPLPKPRTVVPATTEDTVSTESQPDANSFVGDKSPLSELAVPPKPGTIAAREHLKWEQAAPLANNPYSSENIARRQRQRAYLSRHSRSENSIEFPELTGAKEPSLQELDAKHRYHDYNKYVRDYYVNMKDSDQVARDPVPKRPMSAEPRPAASMTNNYQQQQVSVKVEVEVAVTGTSTCTTQKTKTTTSVGKPAQEYISLPSVKQLAKQFCSPDETIPVPTSPIPAKRQSDVKFHSPIRQVHSLTARNISKEFRENLRGSKVTMVPVVKVEKEADSSGHVSEDSGTVSPTPTPCAQPRRLKLKGDIQFWEDMRQQR